ncbi:MAG TPA: Maf family protein [Acidimicrobiia bacterium]|nr:Maf family protein [Acidimicrobiia bacterium]
MLASGSPRRADLLGRLGLEFDVEPAVVDETRLPDEPAAVYVERLARSKALAVGGDNTVVVGADTAVVHAGHVLGKPGHPEEARSMLRRLQGDVHEVFTGVAVAVPDEAVSLVDVTEVRFLPMTEEEIAGYVAGGEPMDKAGAYALQGQGGLFVDSITGNPFTVVGLPIHLLPRLMARLDIDLQGFARDRPV